MGFKKQAKGTAKDAKIAANFERTLLQFIRGKRYKPLSQKELAKQLDIAEIHHAVFKKVLGDLVQTGQIFLEKQKYHSAKAPNLFTGVISVNKKGFGFVRNPDAQDIFVPKHSLKDAVDGDTVEVEVNPVVSSKGPEGIVASVVKRGRTHLAGIVMSKTGRHYIAYAPLLGIDKPLKVVSSEPLKEGDRVVCQVTNWNNDSDIVEGEMTRLIGHISDPSVDVLAAVEEYNIPSDFSERAIVEAKAYGKKVSPEGRRDLTEWEVVTIDPDTAKDFDDAISLTKDEKGHFFLGVHIADVSHYVKPGSHLDREARVRCNSTYFPGKCVPMLPEELSNELCSLKPKVPRLTQSVFAQFDPNGNLVDYQIERTCIKSQKRFTYKEALAVLEKKKTSPHAPLLERMVELCHVLKKKRHDRGSIDFSMPSDVILVDEKGAPIQIERVEYDITHQMIEEFMLKANEITAEHLSKQGKPVVFRIHEEPAEETYQEFFTLARSLGFFLPPEPSHEDIQKLFMEAKDSPHVEQLSISFIRSMRLAAYSSENLGHFGLALDYYCHFTSPIRRYTDLIIQRLLFDELPPDTDVEQVAADCSEKERLSFKAESSVVLLKKLRLAQGYFKEDPTRIYEAVVTKVKPFALFFEVPLFDLEASLHVSKIGNDFYEYNPKTLSFKGSRTGARFAAGCPIFVRLDAIHFILGTSEWSIVTTPTTPAKISRRKRKPKR